MQRMVKLGRKAMKGEDIDVCKVEGELDSIRGELK
jgi:hypothetical protein